MLLRIALFPIEFIFLGGARDYGRSMVTTAVRLERYLRNVGAHQGPEGRQ